MRKLELCSQYKKNISQWIEDKTSGKSNETGMWLNQDLLSSLGRVLHAGFGRRCAAERVLTWE